MRMSRISKIAAASVAAGVMLVGGLSACSHDSDVVSKNLSNDADAFKLDRQIVFYNGITGDYIAEVDGLCAIGNDDPSGQLSVVCKTGPGEYIKDYLGLSDNVTWFMLQTSPKAESDSQYKVTFKPSTVIPDFNNG